MKLVTNKEFAKIIQKDVKTLRNMEKAGVGPQPIRFGRSIRYDLEEVEAYFRTLKDHRPKKSA